MTFGRIAAPVILVAAVLLALAVTPLALLMGFIEHWLSRWEREAERIGLDRHEAGFWTAGEVWILEQRLGRPPLGAPVPEGVPDVDVKDSRG